MFVSTVGVRRVVAVIIGIGLSRQQLGGLHKLIQPIKDKYPGTTYADLFQLASATAIEVIVLSLLKCFT